MESRLAATISLVFLLAAPAAMAERAGAGKSEVHETVPRMVDVGHAASRDGEAWRDSSSGGSRISMSFRSGRRGRHHRGTGTGNTRSAHLRSQRDADRGDDSRGRGAYDRGYTAEDPLGDDGGEESSGAGDRLGGTGNGGGGVIPR